MATKSKIARSTKLSKLLSHKENQEKRADLRRVVKCLKSTPDEKLHAMFTLAGRKVDESPSRNTRRCWKCGRPKGVYRKLGLCRCCIFDAMRRGWLVGFRKASW
ncbi:30S ribosomal protein S14 [Candidatus Synchoanobacter obligatus]|uniref:Small ribosomal subunit protein uS14 n=1 Tax=Candidatus Synchoanobacter obligatus TaxID=2919597 RepID=A0ABT1L5N9_9GAMM|nr:30S ribosomal protein S14 [Candidatus Synchoanobacter obligatus]MCP8352499.1 30S ribosomal protein S14 [Candidatus Synchoanobacter obligatus]